MGGKRREKKVRSAAAPARYSDMFGSVTNRGKDFFFNPALSQEQVNTLHQGNLGASMLGDEFVNLMRSNRLPQTMHDYLNASGNFSLDDYFNNPFRGAAQSLFERPIHSQFGRDQRQLANDLNARGLMGGSFAAMRENDLFRNRDSQLQDAFNRSIFASTDAYNQMINQLRDRAGMAQSYGNNLLAMQGSALGNRGALMNQIYMPMNAWAQVQSATTPGSTALMNYQAVQPTPFERGWDLFSGTTKSAAAGFGQGFGSAIGGGVFPRSSS